MQNEKFYTELNISPEIINKFYSDKNIDSLLLYLYFGFEGSPLGPHIYLKEPFLKDLNNSFPIKYAGVIKLRPQTVYNWHTDTKRRVAINMLLTANNDSHCLFTDNIDQIQIKTAELKYLPNSLYIFNTQYPHMVMNGSSDRWLFSVEFSEDVDYTTLVNWCKNNGYVSENGISG